MRYQMRVSPEVQAAVEDIRSRQRSGWHGQFYIGKGWWPLVAELHQKLVKIDPEYRVLQVKEKFGGLRYYVDFDMQKSDEVWSLINTAELDSFDVCEVCGRPGKSWFQLGWIQTLCRNHYNKARKIKKNRWTR